MSVRLEMQLAFHCDETKFHSSMPRYVLLNPVEHMNIEITIHQTFCLATVDQEDTEESPATETRDRLMFIDEGPAAETRERLMYNQHVNTPTSVSCAIMIIYLSSLVVIGLLAFVYVSCI